MKLVEKLKTISQKAGGALIMASTYAAVARAQAPSSIDLGGGKEIAAVPLIPADNLLGFLGNAVNLILIIAGIAAVAYLIYGGLTYITAGGDSERAGKGRTAITNAIIGVIIIMGSLAIYNWVINAASGTV